MNTVYRKLWRKRKKGEYLRKKGEYLTHTHKTHPYVFKKILGLDGEWLDSTVALLTRDPSEGRPLSGRVAVGSWHHQVFGQVAEQFKVGHIKLQT